MHEGQNNICWSIPSQHPTSWISPLVHAVLDGALIIGTGALMRYGAYLKGTLINNIAVMMGNVLEGGW